MQLNNITANTTAWNGLYAMDAIALKRLVVNGYHSETKADAPAATPSKPYAEVGIAAVIPIVGPICKYANSSPYADDCGVSTLAIQAAIEAAIYDTSIESIVLFIDSPGGTVAGTTDLAGYIATAKTRKPIIAYVSDHCFSAAYWLASQCSSIIANSGAFVGSIGVYSVLVDTSEAAKAMGANVILVAAGEYKGLETDGLPVDPKAIEETQRQVNSAYNLFVEGIAEGRNLSNIVVTQLADGRIHVASEAQALHLIDGIGTLDIAIKLNGESMNDKTKASAVASDAPAAPDSDMTSILKQILGAITALDSKIDALNKPTDSSESSEDVSDDGDSDPDAKAASAVAADRDRLKAISEACGSGREAFALAQHLAGKSPVEAKAALVDVLMGENAQLKKHSDKDGNEPFAIGRVPAVDDNDPEQIWSKNVNNVQASVGGKKDLFLANWNYNKDKANRSAR